MEIEKRNDKFFRINQKVDQITNVREMKLDKANNLKLVLT